MGCGASAATKKYALSLDHEEILEFLSTVPLFKQLPEEEHPVLAKTCEVRDFSPGQVVIRQGDVGKEFFIIRSGEASVHVDRPDGREDSAVPQERPNLRPGDCFGEKALVHDMPRSATIIAETALSTLLITRHKFRELGLCEKFTFDRRKGVDRRVRKTKAKPPSKKTGAERFFLVEAVKRNENLKEMVSLDEEKVGLVVDTCWKESVPVGKTIISESDPTADYFYIIQEGIFEVVTTGENGRSRPVAKLGRGGSFGELALLCLAPRSATVLAATDGLLWVIDRDNFKRILMQNTETQIAQQMAYLESVPILKGLLPHERRELAEAFLELHYVKGELIIEQGKPGIAFYVLVDGEAIVLQDGLEVARLSASLARRKTSYFGETALLNNAPRNATVKVSSALAKALALDRASFNALLGPLEGILKEASAGARKRTGGSRGLALRASAKRGFSTIFRDELAHIGLLGCGGFATVGLCQHKETKELYALKAMSKGYIVKCGMQISVLTEKEILRSCDSPFIVRLFAAYNTDQNVELLLEAAIGGDLHTVYQQRAFYGSRNHATFYTAGVICALQHLHGLKVIYRDLKPENILLHGDGHVKLTDMGLAKVCAGKAYTVCGTPDYFAPEMLKQSGHSFGLDWWALGVLVFELLAGEPPFEAADVMQVYRNINAGIDMVKFPPTCIARAPSSLIRGLLVRDPARRLPMLPGGVENLEGHSFYANLSWPSLRALRAVPPYKPEMSACRSRLKVGVKASDLPPVLPYKDDGSGWDEDFAF